MAPLPYFQNNRNRSRELLTGVIRSMSRTEIITDDQDYLHVTFTSAVFRFVDDVEFQFDDQAQTIHFRSASRVGYYDFGANRRRMKTVSKKYRQALQKAAGD